MWIYFAEQIPSKQKDKWKIVSKRAMFSLISLFLKPQK